jgi:hypothetical protein
MRLTNPTAPQDIVQVDSEISLLISRYFARSCYICAITARPWQLSVTGERCSRPNQGGGQVSNPTKFNFREWLVPSVLLSVFFGMLIAAAVIFQI